MLFRSLSKVRGSERCFHKTTFRYNQCHSCYSGKDCFSAIRVMSIARPSVDYLSPDPKRSRMKVQPALSFSDKDKIGTLQPHDDILVVTLRIGGYDVKRVLVD